MFFEHLGTVQDDLGFVLDSSLTSLSIDQQILLALLSKYIPNPPPSPTPADPRQILIISSRVISAPPLWSPCLHFAPYRPFCTWRP